MSNIEKIKAEIERRKKICEGIFERESDTYYQGKAVAYGELLSFVNSQPEEIPPCQTGFKGHSDPAGTSDLEDAANKYAILDEEGKWKDGGKYNGFIAGAKWMRKKDVEDMYMSDNRHFLKCYEQGKVDMKVQMMKEAVEGEIVKDITNKLAVTAKNINLDGFKFGDKVKIIIVKNEE